MGMPMLRSFLNRIRDLPQFWPASESLPSFSPNPDAADIYVDVFAEASLAPELIMLRSTWL
jgi:hypothetical protein